MPPAAWEASVPGALLSKRAIESPWAASRLAMDSPMIPPPMMQQSAGAALDELKEIKESSPGCPDCRDGDLSVQDKDGTRAGQKGGILSGGTGK